MRILTRTFNFATPWGGVISALLVAIVLGLALACLSGAGFRWDPFNSAERRLQRAEAQAGRALQDSSARRIEAAGALDTTRLIEVGAATIAAADQVVTRQSVEARSAPDANVRLDPDRARRIGDADRELCGLRPSACPGRTAAP